MAITENNTIILNYINSYAKTINEQYKLNIISKDMISLWVEMCSSIDALEGMKQEVQELAKAAVEKFMHEKQRNIIGLGPKTNEKVQPVKTHKLNFALERKRESIKKNIA